MKYYNKSELAKTFKIDRRTVDKLLEGVPNEDTSSTLPKWSLNTFKGLYKTYSDEQLNNPKANGKGSPQVQEYRLKKQQLENKRLELTIQKLEHNLIDRAELEKVLNAMVHIIYSMSQVAIEHYLRKNNLPIKDEDISIPAGITKGIFEATVTFLGETQWGPWSDDVKELFNDVNQSVKSRWES